MFQKTQNNNINNNKSINNNDDERKNINLLFRFSIILEMDDKYKE